jgi:hypothetical protein
MEKHNINNGLIGLNKYVLMKMVEVIAIDEYNKAREEIEENNEEEECIETDDEGNEYFFNRYYPTPIYVELPEKIRNILGVSSELYSIKNHKYFREYIRLFNNNDSEFIADTLRKYEEEENIEIRTIEL